LETAASEDGSGSKHFHSSRLGFHYCQRQIRVTDILIFLIYLYIIIIFSHFFGSHFVPLQGTGAAGHRNNSVSSMDAYHTGGAHLMPGFYDRGIGRTNRQVIDFVKKEILGTDSSLP
jgi:hypothetical protein